MHRIFSARRWGSLLLVAWVTTGRLLADLVIEAARVADPQQIEIRFNSAGTHYYRLLRGSSLERIATPVAIGTSTPFPVAASAQVAFYRVEEVPQDRPLDTDGDGRDDLQELTEGTNPLVLDLAPLAVTQFSSSPFTGEGSVSVTRETVFRFTRPLAEDLVLGASALYAESAGRRVVSRVELGSDRRTATLLYAEPLPGGAQVDVVVDGEQIRDGTGKRVDADRDGIEGGVGRIRFSTMNNVPITGTAVVGRVFASELIPGPDTGTNAINRPLAGATITVDGREETLRTVTDANGNFRLDPAPAGEFFVHIDGRTAVGSQWPVGDYYPFVGKAWTAVPGRTDNLAGGTGDIFLPLIRAGALQPVSGTQDTTITFPAAVLAQNPALNGVSITVPANALFSDSGIRGGRVGLAPVPPDRLPGPLPSGLVFPLVITVQTDGPSNFDRPVPVRFPNLPDPVTGETLVAGAKTGLWSFNHDTGLWQVVGPMTVSEDGRFVESDPGYGLLQPGWHGWFGGCQGSGGPPNGSPGGGGPNGSPPPCPSPNDWRITEQLFNIEKAVWDCAADLLGVTGGIRCLGDAITKTGKIAFKARQLGLDLVAQPPVAGCIQAKEALDFIDAEADGMIGLLSTCLKEGSPAGKAKKIITCLGALLDIAKAVCDLKPPADAPPRCQAPEQVKIICRGVELAKELYDFVANLLKLAEAKEREVELALARLGIKEARNLVNEICKVQSARVGPNGIEAEPELTPEQRLQLAAAFGAVADAAEAIGRDLQTIADQSAQIEEVTSAFLAFTGEARKTIQRFGLPTPATYYYVFELGGVVQRGRTSPDGFLSLPVAANAAYSMAYYDPIGNVYAESRGQSGPPGGAFEITMGIPESTEGKPDSDGDGLADVVEHVLGTDSAKADTDGDGLTDRAEILQGTDPLGGLLAQTGVVAALALPGEALDVCAQDDRVVVALGRSGVAVINTFAGLPPTLVALVETPGDARRVACSGGWIAAADDTRGLAIIDVSNIANARVIHQVALGARAQAVAVSGSVGFVGLDDGRVVAVDLATGGILGTATPGLGVQDLAVSNNTLFGLTPNQLHTWSLGSPFLEPLGQVAVTTLPADPVTRFKRLFVASGRAYATCFQGFDVLEVSNSRQMVRLGASVNHGPSSFKMVVPDGSGLGVVATGVSPNPNDGTHQISLYDLSDPARTDQYRAEFETPGVARAISVARGLVYVAAGPSGLQVLNYRAPDTAGIPPTVTLAASFGSGPAEEGQFAQVTALAQDDGSVREVEFYLDGELWARDGTFPFEAGLVVPQLTSSRTQIVLRARALDRGGNAGWSSELTVALAPDQTPPRLGYSVPQNGDSITTSGVIQLAFDGPLDSTTLSTNNIVLRSAGPDGLLHSGDDPLIQLAEIRFDPATGVLSLIPPSGLPSGSYAVEVSEAVADLSGNRLGQSLAVTFEIGRGLSAEYFLATGFSGPVLEQLDPVVNVNFPAGATRSVRWRGRLAVVSPGAYTLTLTSDGRGRVWLNRQLVLENWVDHSQVEENAEVNLTTGEHDLQVEFQSWPAGGGNLSLRWSGPGFVRQLIPSTSLRPLVDTIPPFLLLPSAEPSFRHVRVRFSEPVEEQSAEIAANYQFDGGIRVLGAELQENGQDVVLETTRLAETTPYRVTVSGVRDASAHRNYIPTNTSVTFYSLRSGAGWLRREVYLGAGVLGNSTMADFLADPRYPRRPEMVGYVTNAEVPVEGVRTFYNAFFGSGQRLIGWVVPPATGNYLFWVESGREGELLVSTDDAPENLRPVARTARGQISRYIWQNEGSPGPIRLERGKRYFVEARHKFFGSDEHFAFAWSSLGRDNFVIEAEDWDFDGGKHLPVVSVMPYFGGAYSNLNSVRGIDWAQRGQPDPSVKYRPFGGGMLNFDTLNDPSRGSWTMTQDFALRSVAGTNEWRNYTRTFPTGQYRVYARITPSSDLESRCALGEVTAGVGTTNQTVVGWGEFSLPRTFGNSGWLMVPLRDTNGQPVVLELGGLKTVRVSGVGQASLLLGLNHLMFVPADAVAEDVPFWDRPIATAAGTIPGQYLATYQAPDGAGLTHWEIYNLPGANGAITNLTENPRYPDSPDKTTLWTLTETANSFDRFGQRLTGCVVPPVSGDYVFHFASDDQGQLLLSTDETPARALIVAAEPIWNGYRDWSGRERRNLAAPENRSAPIRLEAGRRYWYEARAVDSNFGDFDGFTWQLPGGLQPGREQDPLREGTLALAAGPVALQIGRAPAPVSIMAGQAATWEVGVTGLPPLKFQWLRNGQPISGATGAKYTLSNVQAGDDGAAFSVQVDSLSQTITSAPVTLTVTP